MKRWTHNWFKNVQRREDEKERDQKGKEGKMIIMVDDDDDEDEEEALSIQNQCNIRGVN